MDLEFVRAAVNENQIAHYGLPTRPVKTTDTRSKNWTGGECVDIDTLPADKIKELVMMHITMRIKDHEWQTMKAVHSHPIGIDLCSR